MAKLVIWVISSAGMKQVDPTEKKAIQRIEQNALSLKGRITAFFSSLGPGVVAGAADDDPSGIGTYSVAGAQFGTTFLWTAILTWPLMAAVQMMCARIGMVTGKGLAENLKEKIPKPLLIAICILLLFANTLNLGADLSAMADAAEMLTGLTSHIWVIAFGVLISWATIKLRYQSIAKVLKWLALFLFSYIIVTLMIGPDWKSVLNDTFFPSMPKGPLEWSMIVAIFGTTISPYLFFWQTSQEVEEEKSVGRATVAARRGATLQELQARKIDVVVGTFFSNIVMYFIILATALTLFKNGIHNIETSRQAAEALRPLAGNLATLLYTVGLLGVGFLAIPTLTGSAAYALSETFGWKEGLDEKFLKAKSFYFVIICSTVIAIAFDFYNINPVKALYWSAVVNGLLAPFLLLAILFVASDFKLMQGQPSSLLAKTMVWVTTLIMFLASFAMFIF